MIIEITLELETEKRTCALCGTDIIDGNVNLCQDCIKNADCCVGLEKLND